MTEILIKIEGIRINLMLKCGKAQQWLWWQSDTILMTMRQKNERA